MDPARPPSPGVVEPLPEAERDATRVLLFGGVMLVVGLAVVAQNAGLNARLGILLPLLVVAAGAVLAWSQLDDRQRGRWLGGESGTGRFSAARLVFGGVLALAGLVIMATRGRSLGAIWDIGAAVVAVLAGVALIAAPWGLRFWADLRHEQSELARATERADIAAHLHDSVLQTLALIQRKAEDPARGHPARPCPGTRAAVLAVCRTDRQRRDARGRGGGGGARGRGPARHTGRCRLHR